MSEHPLRVVEMTPSKWNQTRGSLVLALSSLAALLSACEETENIQAAAPVGSLSSDAAADEHSGPSASSPIADASSRLPLTQPASGPDASSSVQLVERTCIPPEGVSASPTDMLQVIELINTLPHPVSIGCFLESLDRPLEAYATWSIVSAQPADGVENPRVFLLFGDTMIISVVPSGLGSEVIEFGQITEGTRALKAELHFPVSETLSPSAGFETIAHASGGTLCRLCHAQETPFEHDVFEQAYESQALRPNPDYEVSLEATRLEYEACDAELTPERCDILRGLYAHGPVVRREFPPEMPIFF